MTRPLRAATRGSRLALRQVELVAELLGLPIEPVVVSTMGDRMADVPLRSIAGTGAFAGDVREALAAGAADIAVHSAKDLPPRDDPRFELFFPTRADPRDALVGATLGEIPPGGTVGTGAPRRRAQLAALRPDLRFAELRGNIDTRLEKAIRFSAIVVAAAALQRLRIVPEGPTQLLPVDEFVPQVGQGVLAVEIRTDDRTVHAAVAPIDDAATRVAVSAERAFLDELGGDCDLPAGAHATSCADGSVMVDAVLAGTDGTLHRAATRATDAATAGREAAVTLRCALASAGPVLSRPS